MQFNQAHNLIKKLIKRRLLFDLVLIINCNVKKTHKRSSVINSIYSGQQHFLMHLTKLERLARDKHSNLLNKCLNYGRKKFYKISPRSRILRDSRKNWVTSGAYAIKLFAPVINSSLF